MFAGYVVYARVSPDIVYLYDQVKYQARYQRRGNLFQCRGQNVVDPLNMPDSYKWMKIMIKIVYSIVTLMWSKCLCDGIIETAITYICLNYVKGIFDNLSH